MLLQLFKKTDIYLSVVCLLLINLFVALQISSRFFDLSITWVIELSTLLVIFMVFLLIGRNAFEDSHMKVDFFLNMFNKKVKKFVEMFIYMLNITTGVIVLVSVLIYIGQISNFGSPQMGIPMQIYFYPVVFGFSLMVLAYVNRFFLTIKTVFKK